VRVMDLVKYLSYTLSETTPLYGNGTGVAVESVQQLQRGDSCNTMRWTIPNHAGTHIDAPRHFSEKGRTITDYSPDFWVFNRVELIDISEKIQDGLLIEPDIFPCFFQKELELLIIKTGYGRYRGTDRYTMTAPGISAKVAFWLRGNYPFVRCVGTDLVSISSFTKRDEGRHAHRAFLSPEAGDPILLIEDMKLDNGGPFKKVVVAPLLVEKADGTPCTVFGFF
jgi:arylformamidase